LHMEEENAIVHELVALGFEEVEVRCALAAGMVQLDEAVNWYVALFRSCRRWSFALRS